MSILVLPMVTLRSTYPSFLGGSDGKEFACNAGDRGSISRLGRSPGGGNGNSFQYSCLGNPMDRGARRATVHGVTESDMTERLHFHFLSVLKWSSISSRRSSTWFLESVTLWSGSSEHGEFPNLKVLCYTKTMVKKWNFKKDFIWKQLRIWIVKA